MDLKQFEIDMFSADEGVPSIVLTTDSGVQKYQTLKPVERGVGHVTNQTIIMRNGYINKVILGGIDDGGHNFIKEFVYLGDRSIPMQAGKKEAPAEELQKFREYIANHSWRNAKTYADFSPHQYIINMPCWKIKEDGKCSHDCERCKKERAEFEHWVMFIREYGEKVIYGRKNFTCLRVDEKHYWTMGEVLETTWVLNRAITDDSRYKVRMQWVERND